MEKTIVISAAGRGSRLGLGIPKSLIDIGGNPLIIRQLELLADQDDIRVVVGYQADRVREVVSAYRRDILFFTNDAWETTGTAASFCIGAAASREMVVALDGDLLVAPADMRRFLALEDECACGCVPGTDEPMLMSVDSGGQVTAFSRTSGQWEWTGLAQIKREHIVPGMWHVCNLLETVLPIRSMLIDCREVDTPHDYENAVAWYREKKEMWR